MDAIMTFLLQAMLLAVLLVFFALMTLAAYALVWSVYHMAHDHWTSRRLWHEVQTRMHHHAH